MINIQIKYIIYIKKYSIKSIILQLRVFLIRINKNEIKLEKFEYLKFIGE